MEKKTTEFADKFRTQKELQEYAHSQFLSLMKANKRIEHLEIENRQLKEEITQISAKESIITKSAEQELCEIELSKLRDNAKQRELTLEETKRMDLLVKNLYLAIGKPNSLKQAKNKNEVDDEKLIALALVAPNEQ